MDLKFSEVGVIIGENCYNYVCRNYEWINGAENDHIKMFYGDKVTKGSKEKVPLLTKWFLKSSYK